MYNFTVINPENYIADDLPSINLNYQKLDQWVSAMALSATNFWEPLSAIYTGNRPKWEKAITTVIQNSAKWEQVSAVVETYSASWLKPLTIIFPNVYDKEVSIPTIVTTIGNWLNEKFPVVIDGEIPYFVEGQQAIVSQYSQENIVEYTKELKELFASTTCSTRDGIGWSNCLTRFKGTVNCGPQGTLYCDGQTKTCPISQEVKCKFEPPYIATTTDIIGQLLQNTVKVDDNFNFAAPLDSRPTFGTSPGSGWFRRKANQVAIGAVQANLYLNYKDTREVPIINTFKFRVKDCKWEYANALHGQAVPFEATPKAGNQFDMKLAEAGAESARGYYMINNDGYATIHFLPVGTSQDDLFDINVNGSSYLTNFKTTSVLKFSGLASRTYVIRVTNLTSGLQDVLNLSIGYRSRLGYTDYIGGYTGAQSDSDVFIGDRFLDDKTIIEDVYGDSLPFAAYAAGDALAGAEDASLGTFKLLAAKKNSYAVKTFPRAKNILYTAYKDVSAPTKSTYNVRVYNVGDWYRHR
jgi:hypothetical protein